MCIRSWRAEPGRRPTDPSVLVLSVLRAEDLTPAQRSEMLGICSLAFETDYEPYYRSFAGAVHVFGMLDRRLVSHALWVPRWLEVGPSERHPWGPRMLRTAYVEAVATHPDYRRRGYARAVMQRLAHEISGYDLGALSPGVPSLYEQLGWEYWSGPLSARSDGGILATPDDEVMILRLRDGLSLDLDASLSCEWRDGEVW